MPLRDVLRVGDRFVSRDGGNAHGVDVQRAVVLVQKHGEKARLKRHFFGKLMLSAARWHRFQRRDAPLVFRQQGENFVGALIDADGVDKIDAQHQQKQDHHHGEHGGKNELTAQLADHDVTSRV